MNKTVTALAALIVLSFSAASMAGTTCAKIKDGTITDVNGNPISVGYDQWGYNYQAKMFNGLYGNFSRPPVPVTEGSENLIMKWSDEWLSNQDCDGDGKLDRGGDGSGSSKGWLTNHMEGDYLGDDGEYHHYTYFVKIVYDGGAACGAGAASCLWNVFTIIEEVYNDPYGGYHGVNRDLLVNPAGLGFYN